MISCVVHGSWLHDWAMWLRGWTLARYQDILLFRLWGNNKRALAILYDEPVTIK